MESNDPNNLLEDHLTSATMIRVEVLLALPDRAWSVPLLLVDGATVGDALEKATPSLPSLAEIAWSYGIFGRLVSTSMMLRDGDRVEVLRPLQADPMDQRRRRASMR